MKTAKTFVGLDIGGTNLKVIALTATGQRLAAESLPTIGDDSSEWLERARDVVRRVLAQCPAPARIGVAAPGLPALAASDSGVGALGPRAGRRPRRLHQCPGPPSHRARRGNCERGPDSVRPIARRAQPV